MQCILNGSTTLPGRLRYRLDDGYRKKYTEMWPLRANLCVHVKPAPQAVEQLQKKHRVLAPLGLVNPHQRCGYSDSPFASIYFAILQGPETDLREWKRCVDSQKNRKPYQKDTFFLWKNVLRTSDRMKNTCRICWKR